MKNVRQTYKSVSLILLLGIAVTASAWQYTGKDKKQGNQDKHDQRDTTKSGKHYYGENEYRMNELNLAMDQLNAALKDMKVELKGLDSLDVNIDAEVKLALSKIDFDKVRIETDKAMKAIDWDQIRKNVDVSLKQAEQEMKKVNTEQIKANLKVVQDQLNSENFKKQIEESMSKAKEGLAAAKVELQNIKAFTEALQSDGLIDKKKGYTVELKDGSLIINGTPQSKDVTEKYRKYYKKDNFRIVSDGEGMISL